MNKLQSLLKRKNQTKKKILLCPPTHFAVKYQINPWMNIENNVDPQLAMVQYEKLKAVYQELGAEVLEIEQDKNLPDMVYIANCGFPIGKTFIKSNFRYEERMDEAEHADLFMRAHGYDVKAIPDKNNFEGQGDLLTDGKRYFFGWGKRSMLNTKKYLKEYLQSEIYDFEMQTQHFYHLDMCFMPLNEKVVVLYDKGFKEDDLHFIHKLFPTVIKVSAQDADNFACNGVVVDNAVVTGEGISNQLKEEYEKHGFIVYEVPMSEYIKGGGSVKCLTLEFF